MSMRQLQARFRSLRGENLSWRLLAAENGPLLLAFIADLFDGQSELPYAQARTALESELLLWRQEGLSLQESASAYLRQWIQHGWLREHNDHLVLTDSAEVALRFVQSLEQRQSRTTASRLRLLQDRVSELAFATGASPEQRLQRLQQRQQQLQHDIDRVREGEIEPMPDAEQFERLQEIYQLALELSGDFRRVEEEIRQLNHQLRIEMVSAGRGEIVDTLLQKEQQLHQSSAGRAFNAFFQLLCDIPRTTELREELRQLLNISAADHLRSDQRRFLGRLVRELNRESERVFQIRRKTEEGLRQFIERGSYLENRQIDRLLGELERKALQLQQHKLSPSQLTTLSLPTGSVECRSANSLQLKQPQPRFNSESWELTPPLEQASEAMLRHLHPIRMDQIAHRLQQQLQQHGSQSLATLASALPIEAGLEELVIWLRLAQMAAAAPLEQREQLQIRDPQGDELRATIPVYRLSASDLEQLKPLL
ncbi:DUF3375 domain-containing protein [Ectothiorhodospiraceae bacterium BW-2]|nr:DUF3375 domain-containing protein [Ectothiorhodospiraceae bacterium BW-2]